MKISFSSPTLPKQGAIVTGVLAERKLTPSAADLDRSTGGAIKRALQASRFKGKTGEILELLSPRRIENSRILLVGLGDPAEFAESTAEEVGGAVVAHLNATGEAAAAILLGKVAGAKLDPARQAAHCALGALLRSYRFDKYRTKEGQEKKPSLKRVAVLTEDAKAAQRAFAPLAKIAEGVFLTRDLVSEPANVIFPKSLVAEAKKLEKLGVKVEALGEKEMRKLGMHALLGVGQGSEHESQLLVMQWSGAPKAKDKRPLAFIGKGITFDTGGISIKPAAGMEDMKWDMGGAGVVVGLMRALAGRKAKVNAIGICGLAENMPDGRAQRPGDIVHSMSGQTIEVINTDAEGRLVLADALWYAQDRFAPRLMVDLATLTGAIIIALGHEHAGLFANDDELAERLTAAGKAVGEPLWRLPLGAAYDKAIDSDAADMKNVGNRAAGSITAAQFLQRFVKDDLPWAHLDIAGVAWGKKDKATVPKGGTAFGVRLLDRFVAAHYER